MADDFLAFDLETQRSAQDVGGWNNIPDMKMSVGVLWDSTKNDFFVYLEDQIEDMINHLLAGPRVIGFNHIYFDYPVVSGYREAGPERDELMNRFTAQKNLDLLIDLKDRLGHRLKLDSVARPTLEVGKSADGLLALEWYQQYVETGDQSKMDSIISYCKQDVAVTRDVYLYGIEKGEILYEAKGGAIKTVSVDWTEQAQETPSEPQAEQLSLF